MTMSTCNKSSLSLLATVVVAASWATPAYAVAAPSTPGFGMGITELTEDLKYVPNDECFYPVTFKPHLDAGETDYAFIPYSYLPSDTVIFLLERGISQSAIQPDGAWAYKQNFTTDLAYSMTNRVEVDAPNVALVFGDAEPFMEPYKTFAEVEAADNLTGWQAMARTGIVCTQANMTSTFEGYSKYAWVSVDDQPDRALGAFVFELADGTGLVRHPDMGGSDEDGPTTDNEPNTNEESANTLSSAENSGCVYPLRTTVLTIIFALLTNYAI